MFDSHKFYKQRLAKHLKETGRYLKYIFTGHMMIVLLFFISAIAVYYQQWLASLPENFPTALVMGLVLGLLVSYSPVRTLLREPDLVFLIAAEHKMKAYFRNTLIYSFVIQLYLVLLAIAAFGPLYFASFPNRSGKMYLLLLAVVLIFKGWNLITNWWMLRARDPRVRQVDLLIRIILNIAVFYFIVAGNMLFCAIATILFILVFLYDYHLSRKQPGIAWDLLVEKDQNRMQAFYRIANMFAEVPHLKSRVKKRQWIVSLVSKVPFSKKYTFDYLYRITFVRSGDYLGMYVRLIIVGGLFIYFIPNIAMKILFAILFLYLSSFQMMTLYQHHRTVMWLDLYPVDFRWRKDALVKIIYQLTIFQAVLFALLFLIMQLYASFLIALVAGIAFTFIFINGYIKRKLV